MQNLKGLKLEKAQFPTKILRCLRLLGHHHLTLQLASLLAREGEGEANLVQKDSFQDAHSHSPRAGLLTGRPGVCGGCFFRCLRRHLQQDQKSFLQRNDLPGGKSAKLQSCQACEIQVTPQSGLTQQALEGRAAEQVCTATLDSSSKTC